MKVLLLSYSDAGGGAAIAALRLAIALREFGVDAILGVVEKHSAYNFVVKIPAKKRIIFRLERKLLERFDAFLLRHYHPENTIFHSINLYSRVDVDWINHSDFDVINLHWINHNMISVCDIGRIRKPLVWTMHDSWPVCGAEHHPSILHVDNRYKTGYKAGEAKTYKGIDLSRAVFRRKERCWSKLKIHFIAPSSWEYSILTESQLFIEHKAWSGCIIPNIVDSTVFFPLEVNVARKALGLNSDARFIGFGTANIVSGGVDLKGSHFIKPALDYLHTLHPEYNLAVLLFGPVDQEFVDNIGMPVFSAGQIQNESILRLLYNCCNVFVCPSIVESFGLTVLEAGSSGIGTVAFKTTGIVDIIKHRKNGYLAEPFDHKDLAEGIAWCLENEDTLKERSRDHAIRNFNKTSIVLRYIEAYENALKEPKN